MSNIVKKQNNVVKAGFDSEAGFELLQRQASMFNQSTLVPKIYTGKQNFGNCVIALNMAQRMNADPLMVMQNLYVVHGNPSWSSKFLISMFNQCGRFSSIRYKEVGEKGTDTEGVIACALEHATGEVVYSPAVTIGLAKKEGWFNKNGSKWQTMPEMMMRYRAATWLIRLTAPELSMGLQTKDEVIDIGEPAYAEAVVEEIAENANSVVLEETDSANTNVIDAEENNNDDPEETGLFEEVSRPEWL